jgi:hypothetical protein
MDYEEADKTALHRALLAMTPVPKDFEVQPLGPWDRPRGATQCGHCGLWWDDDKVTGWTPAPSARCPFEYFHIHEED